MSGRKYISTEGQAEEGFTIVLFLEELLYLGDSGACSRVLAEANGKFFWQP